MNDRERPRVLLWSSSSTVLIDFDWLEQKAGTFRRVFNLGEVDLGEWDVLVTDEAYSRISMGQYGQPVINVWSRVPDRLFIFRTFSEESNHTYFEFNVDSNNYADPKRALTIAKQVPGHKMTRVGGLPEPIQDLVKSSLLPAVEARKYQYGVQTSVDELAPAVINLRPFLIGPAETMMAASYQRPGGGHIWLIPDDAPDLSAWFDAALTEWHTADRRTFPNVSTWQTDGMWDTAEERRARKAVQLLDDEFAEKLTEYEEARRLAQVVLDDAAARALTGPKALLTSQDDLLQDAVQEALTKLGFDVVDMDKVWPDRERREDFRITDAEAPGWLVLADATGVAKGAPGSKITTIAGYVTKYVLEERPTEAPGMWVIVNRLFHRDPTTRGEIYRSDDLTVLASQKGLAIDSAALFRLTEDILPGTPRAASARSWLRNRTGQVTIQDAMEWLSTNL